MFLDRAPFIYLWRPIYRLVFDGIIHPIVLRLWTYVALQPLPPSPPAGSIAAQLRELEQMRESLRRIDASLAESKQEWLATEKLMVALIQNSGGETAGAPAANAGIERADRKQ